MRVHNLSQINTNNNLSSYKKLQIDKIARATGFHQRKSKLSASILITAFIYMLHEKRKSYWDWAISVGRILGEPVSKQAIFKRMTEYWIETVKKILQKIIQDNCCVHIDSKHFGSFKNVWLQDSTTLKLPEIMFDRFTGCIRQQVKLSVAKLNIVINPFTGACPVMDWMGNNVNEQSISSSVIELLKAGDLLIRDLGYFVLEAFQKMHDGGIFFLSRLRYGVKLYDMKTGEEIKLMKLINGRSMVDVKVFCGTSKKLCVRLVAIKLSAEQANARIRKAKKDTYYRVNHSPDYYQQLGYVIFITNVKKETWDYKQVANAYRIRWNIETLFKSWKSGLRINEIIPNEKRHVERIESILYLILIYISWFLTAIYYPLMWQSLREKVKLSIIKVTRYLSQGIFSIHNLPGIVTQIKYHCAYEKRNRRVNAVDGLSQFYSTLS